MSNILSDQNRQTIAFEIIQTIQPQCYVDVGCYEGTSMEWWLKCGRVPQAFGVDLNETAVALCAHKNEGAMLHVGDSVEWLQKVEAIPSPAVFYLDTDWNENLRKQAEMAVIFERWPKSVMIVNGVNREGHPLYKKNGRPWDVYEMFETWKLKGCIRQFLHPIYPWPQLQQGYLVINGCQELKYDSSLFQDLMHTSKPA